MAKIDLRAAHRIKNSNIEWKSVKKDAIIWERHPLEQHYGDGPDKIHFHLCHRTVNKTGPFQPTRNFAPLAVNMTRAKGTADVENNLVSFTPITEIHMDNGLELVGSHIVFVVDLANITNVMGFFGRLGFPTSSIRVGSIQSDNRVFMSFIQRQVSSGAITNIQTGPRFLISRTGLSIIHAIIEPTNIKSWVHDLQNGTVSPGNASSGYSSFIVDILGNGQNIGVFNGRLGEVVVMKQGANSMDIVDNEVIPYLKSIYQ